MSLLLLKERHGRLKLMQYGKIKRLEEHGGKSWRSLNGRFKWNTNEEIKRKTQTEHWETREKKMLNNSLERKQSVFLQDFLVVVVEEIEKYCRSVYHIRTTWKIPHRQWNENKCGFES